ncbi:MAG: YdcF family protein [Pirellulaceae bacterium]
MSGKRMVLGVAVVALVLVSLGFLFDGKTGLEKTATRLLFPVGLLWLTFSGLVVERLWSIGLPRSLLWVLAWGLLTVASTTPLADQCMRHLEESITVYQPGVDPPLDVVVVLGGGTFQGPTRAEAGNSGDRVLFAAELFQQGYARRLITTGRSTPGLGLKRTSPQEHTLEIWTKLGIDRESVGTLDGINTYQEIQNLKALMPELRGQRVGLLTSAYHLPRAMRLAHAAGLDDLIPVAADYESSTEAYSFTDFVPSASPLEKLARCQHEFMAWFVGR